MERLRFVEKRRALGSDFAILEESAAAGDVPAETPCCLVAGSGKAVDEKPGRRTAVVTSGQRRGEERGGSVRRRLPAQGNPMR